MSEQSPFLRNLVVAAQENPLAATFVGLGALCLVSGTAGFASIARKASGGAYAVNRNGMDATRAATEGMSEGAQGLASRMSDAAGALAKFVPDHESIADLRSRATSTLGDIFERQPLAVGLLGLVSGALVASAFPTSGRESDLMGAASLQAKDDLRRRMEAVKPIAEIAAHDLSNETGAAVSELTEKTKQAGVDAFRAVRESLIKGPSENQNNRAPGAV
jgi:hypothetical protein